MLIIIKFLKVSALPPNISSCSIVIKDCSSFPIRFYDTSFINICIRHLFIDGFNLFFSGHNSKNKG
nr:MAG TPA: hypothetical protein [Caudoviricetes sp.]